MARSAQTFGDDSDNPPREEISARIVGSARQYFLAHGFRSVTMDDLAEGLGMSKKTLYANFSSKTSLVKAVLLAKVAEVEKDLSEIVSDPEFDFAAALQRVLVCIQRHTQEIQPPFMRDMQRDAPELFALVESRRQEIIQQHFGKLLTEGRKAGLVRKDIPIKLIIEILLAAVHGVMNPGKLLQLGLSPRTGYSAIISILLEGVLVQKQSGAL